MGKDGNFEWDNFEKNNGNFEFNFETRILNFLASYTVMMLGTEF